MTITTFFSSASKEQRWVDQTSKKFKREIAIDISGENPICVFNIPKSITIFKPEAYLPQVIALGPYHHMVPHLYHMERYKISCAKSFFIQSHSCGQGNIKFREILINKFKQLDHVIRGCYHSYLDLDDDTLSWIVAIDGLFLVNVLQDYFVEPESKRLVGNTILFRDLMLLENQIPFVVLREIYRTLKTNSSETDNESELFFMMARFCQANSPLQLSPISSCPYNETSHLHLLDLMYHLMVKNGFPETERSPQDEENSESRNSSEETEDTEEDMNSACDNIGEITEIAMKFGIGRKILKPVAVIQDIPWDKIMNISGLKIVKDPDKCEGLVVEEIKIPCVYSLHYYAGITFRPTSEGIRGIKFIEQEAALYLPVITLDVNSEVLLRNLVAYETTMNYSNSSPSFSQYIDMLSGIIDRAEDARLLKEKGIIKGELSNNMIAELFNGMNKTTRNSRNKTVAKINNYYKKRLMVRMFKFMKKRWFSLWKVITHLLTVLLLLLLVLYLFCQFYGCPKIFGGSN
ncbi:hypothetical protein L1987_31191 [Smallanthus sonchifolius]|uniref:Uncharacterized protein n=1 Tax=Smallanthus sonchifolius TaxID=185202 RepID=A0ACB9I646_9ASTR|nr:hypothetical protein L1987_31191 [Smallanthus sonchifolius]